MRRSIRGFPTIVGMLGILSALQFSKTAHAIDINDSMELRGYLDLEWSKYTFGDEAEESSSFQQHFANIMFKARPMPGVFMMTNVEFQYGGIMGTEHTSTAASRATQEEEEADKYGSPSISLHGAFMEIDLPKHFKLRAGQFSTPFGHFNEVHDVTPVYYSVSIPDAIYAPQKLGGFEAIPRFNTGLGLIYDPGPFMLTAFIGNGFGGYGGLADTTGMGGKGIGLRVETDPVKPIAAYLTVYHAQIQEEEDETESHWGAAVGSVMSLGDAHFMIEAIGAKYEEQLEVGGFAEVGWHSIKYFVPFLQAQALAPDLLEDGFKPNYLLVAGGRIELKPGRIFLKIEHNVKFGNSMEPEGELRAAIVGWY